MSTSPNISSSPETLTVVTWNILHDVRRTKAGLIHPQYERAPALASRLIDLRDELQTPLDVVGLQEVHNETSKQLIQHNGIYISEALEYGEGHWLLHNEKVVDKSGGRTNEFIGFTGARVHQIEKIELGDNRLAVLTYIGGVAVVNIHTRARFRNRELQKEQVEVVLDLVAKEESVAFMGDFNSWILWDSNSRARGMARRAVEAEGFESVFTRQGRRHPKTFPTPEYRNIMYGKARYIAPSVALDDIYVRGLHVYEADSFKGDSDHAGLWAKIGVPSTFTPVA